MKRKTLFFIITLSFLFGFGGAALFYYTLPNSPQQDAWQIEGEKYKHEESLSIAHNIEHSNKTEAAMGIDFVYASKTATPSVVFIKTTSEVRTSSPFWFFDSDPFGSIGQVSSTGSGVIMSQDGYIVTNLHVVRNAIKIEVVLNNRKKVFLATLIGSDPSTDLALLKIEAENLPAIQAGNSDHVQIGEWVLAVGNPFNLTSTVTAGIVSAKGRNINIVNNQFPIESFIQTDAAINPGNSGGALVDLQGKLVGINTAILSKTGAYSGYGFAIPINIVAKTVKDLIEFGEVQRGFAGMDVADIDYETQKKLNITYDNGVYVAQVLEDGPAYKAGIRAGDLILSIQDREVPYKALYDEYLAYQRPGDKISLTLKRNNKKKEVVLTLINKEGNTELVRRNLIRSDVLGASFSKISKMEMQRYKIENGVKVSEINQGLIKRMGIQEDFIFLSYNGKPSIDPEQLIEELSQASGRMQIEGITPDGRKRFYNFYGY